MRPESIKALGDKSHSLQPTGLQELHNCLRSKRSQVLQDAFPSNTGYYSAGQRVGLSLYSACEILAPEGHPAASIKGQAVELEKRESVGSS